MPSVNLYLGDLDKVISTQLSLFKISNGNIKWSYSNELPNNFKLLIDSQQIRQGLTNIFQNSVDSINENPKISQGIINIYTKLKNEKVLLVIEDNGSGFPEDRENLTNPYITFRKKGTGLGLSIVKRIVEEHNGKLILRDSKFGGAEIIIEFLI